MEERLKLTSLRHSEACLTKRTNDLASWVSLSAFFRHPELVSGSTPLAACNNRGVALARQTSSVTLNLFQGLLPSRYDDNREVALAGQTNIDRSRTKFGMTQSEIRQSFRHPERICVRTECNESGLREYRVGRAVRLENEAIRAWSKFKTLVSGSKNNDMSNNKRIQHNNREEDNVHIKNRKSFVMTKEQTTTNRSRNEFGMTKRCAFTLAEVLITLGIIGVVAAMTLPTLINKYQEKATVTQLKKTYSILNQAFNMAVAENGSPEAWDWQSAVNVFNQNLKPYLKILKDCETGTGCWHDGNLKTLNGGDSGISLDSNTAYEKAIFADGISFALASYGGSCDTVRGDSRPLDKVCAYFFVDLNGKKSPNTYGKDLFYLYITRQGIFPAGTPDNVAYGSIYAGCNPNSSKYNNGQACSSWVIFKENMDYLKKEVSW